MRSHIVLECWRQAADFGHQPSAMVMGCLGNRFRLGWGSWLEVLCNVPKFSSTLEQPNRDKWPNVWDPNFIKLLHAVDGIYDGSIPNPAGDGLFWADLSKGRAGITNPWFQTKVIDNPARSVCANQNAFTLFK